MNIGLLAMQHLACFTPPDEFVLSYPRKGKHNPFEIQHLYVNLTLQDKQIKMDNLPETNHSSKQRLSLVVMLLSLDSLICLSYNENTNKIHKQT